MRIRERVVKGYRYLYFRGPKQDLILANLETQNFNEENIDKSLECISSVIDQHYHLLDDIISGLPSNLRTKYENKYKGRFKPRSVSPLSYIQ